MPLPIKCKTCAEKVTGRTLLKNSGYTMARISEKDFFYPMARKRTGMHTGELFEHRLVMAKHLGRCLHPWEIVHHKNSIKTDNRIENLQLVTDDRHKQITIMELKIERLEDKVKEQEEHIRLLEWQIKEIKYPQPAGRGGGGSR
jgi:hypothetical protein